MTSPDPTAGTVGPVFGSQAADNAAWDEVRNALASATPGRISDADLDDLTGAVTPILARLVDSAREAGRKEGREGCADDLKEALRLTRWDEIPQGVQDLPSRWGR